MYHISKLHNDQYDQSFYMFIHLNRSTGQAVVMWSGNINDPRLWHTNSLQEAIDKLLYIKNLCLMGKCPPAECLSVVDGNGKEVYLEAV